MSNPYSFGAIPAAPATDLTPGLTGGRGGDMGNALGAFLGGLQQVRARQEDLAFRAAQEKLMRDQLAAEAANAEATRTLQASLAGLGRTHEAEQNQLDRELRERLARLERQANQAGSTAALTREEMLLDDMASYVAGWLRVNPNGARANLEAAIEAAYPGQTALAVNRAISRARVLAEEERRREFETYRNPLTALTNGGTPPKPYGLGAVYPGDVEPVGALAAERATLAAMERMRDFSPDEQRQITARMDAIIAEEGLQRDNPQHMRYAINKAIQAQGAPASTLESEGSLSDSATAEQLRRYFGPTRPSAPRPPELARAARESWGKP